MQRSDTTTFGPFQRLTILTKDAVIEISGENVLASFSFHDDGRPRCTALSAVRYAYEVERCATNSATVRPSDREGFFDLVERETSSEKVESCSDHSHSDVEENTTQVDGMESRSQSESGLPDPEWIPNAIPKSGTSSSSDKDHQCSSESASVHIPDAETTDSSSALHSSTHSMVQGKTVPELTESPSLSGSNSQDPRGAKKYVHHKHASCAEVFSDLSCHHYTHAVENSHACDTCGKAYSRSGNLIRHVCSHTGENLKPYSCGTCGKAFSHSGNLRS